jgi:hypothetical protein
VTFIRNYNRYRAREKKWVLVVTSISSQSGLRAHRLFWLLGPGVSPLAVPTVYFDTSVVSWAEAGKISSRQWKEALDFVRQCAHHAVSLTTLYELMAGLAYGSEEQFVRFRDRFALLLIGAQQTFLPLTGEFVRTRIFGLPSSRPEFDPEILRRWLPVIMRARTRQEMENGLVELRSDDSWTFGVNLQLIKRQILKGKAKYIRRLKKLRLSHPEPLSIETWAADTVSALKLELTLANRLKVESALNALYWHDVSMRNKAQNEDFNFKKNSTAWLDSSQLFYLADPAFVFVTADDKFIDSLAASTQRSRVLSFWKLLELASA